MGKKLDLIHPGMVIQDVLNDTKMVRNDLAHMMCLERKAINALCEGRLSISPRLAHKLSKALGASPRFWLNLQHHYEVEQLNNIIEDS